MLICVDAIGCTKRFHHAKTEWGLDKLLPLCTFNDADNGFLADDSCVFGVELFLVRDSGEGESMSLVKDFKQATHRWTIDNLLDKIDGKVHSEEFSVGGPRGDYKWCISVYLNGAASHAGGKFMSVSLHLDTYPQVPRGKVYAEYKLRIKPQFSGKEDYEKEGRLWFCCPLHYPRTSENSDAFIDYPTLANSFLSGDGRRLVVEAEIMSIGLVEGFN
ncbi:hypothetical protein RJ639_016507 [Escallonia herrerae]|uniref:MATH domain-containing protein n=1 Tax=Escallonia herrerae TaxID=1293975 RepID=A0AA89AK04_9ASTE|nr:hypothetical protein RJ639_016507 [Escallonia herrerae]